MTKQERVREKLVKQYGVSIVLDAERMKKVHGQFFETKMEEILSRTDVNSYYHRYWLLLAKIARML
jgi:hypothetical protein